MQPIPLRHARGMTLIEIIIAIVITSILVIGLSGMWVLVDDQFLRIAQRERALLVLNGQLERLSSLYRYTNFINEQNIHSDDIATIPTTVEVPAINVPRQIYRADPGNNGVVGMLLIETANANVTKAAFDNESRILFMDTVVAANDSNERNVVWLDRALNFTATFSWHLEDLSNAGAGLCFDAAGRCYLLVARLEYPFRFIDNTNPAQTIYDQPQVLELRTVVGERL